jgi:hypothetical protein
MRKYKKSLTVHYKYIDNADAERALYEIFDDIFKRIIQKRGEKILLKNEAKY